jgi:hypothetical protein
MIRTDSRTYSSLNTKYIDKVILKKRREMFEVIKKTIHGTKIKSLLDVGTTQESDRLSSNFLVKCFNKVPIKYSISDQKIIKSKLFKKCIQRSIVRNLNKSCISLKSDLLISSATIEHLGNKKNIKKGILNMIKLTKKYFVITTPNRFYPLDFHTKLPLIHFLPKKIHRFILRYLGHNFLSKEENLNLLSRNDLITFFCKIPNINYDIKTIKLFGLVSNFIVIGKKLNS